MKQGVKKGAIDGGHEECGDGDEARGMVDAVGNRLVPTSMAWPKSGDGDQL